MSISKKKKYPDSLLDYPLKWNNWLVDGDTILESEWIVDEGITLTASTYSDNIAVAWLSGGQANSNYYATNRIKTLDGREDERTIRIICIERPKG